MRSIDKTLQEIKKLDIFLSVSPQNVNDLPAGVEKTKDRLKLNWVALCRTILHIQKFKFIEFL
jgi:hypothetical protein